MSKDALIIFIKNPVKGKVKTRLAQTAGEDRALAIYQELLRHTRHVALSVHADRLLFYSDRIDPDDDWLPADFKKSLQQGRDLGQRMENAFSRTLEHYDKAVIIGSDCPGLNADIIRQAFRQLDRCDYVIGPATDGGYYLLGMTQSSPELFRDMTWSTDAVFAETMKRINARHQSCFLLPERSDIDYEKDWERIGWDL